jgi:hypothetical protein
LAIGRGPWEEKREGIRKTGRIEKIRKERKEKRRGEERREERGMK